MLKRALPPAFLVACTAIAFATVPADSWRFDSCHLAAIGGLATSAALLVTRFLGPKGFALERPLLAVFLASMPLVYVGSGLEGGKLDFVEVFAVPVYGALAYLGIRRSAWYLAGGIAAHGLLWDAWHHAAWSVVPGWYATGCLVLDLAIAVYAATRLHAARVTLASSPA
jgi:hypothetical protein